MSTSTSTRQKSDKDPSAEIVNRVEVTNGEKYKDKKFVLISKGFRGIAVGSGGQMSAEETSYAVTAKREFDEELFNEFAQLSAKQDGSLESRIKSFNLTQVQETKLVNLSSELASNALNIALNEVNQANRLSNPLDYVGNVGDQDEYIRKTFLPKTVKATEEQVTDYLVLTSGIASVFQEKLREITPAYTKDKKTDFGAIRQNFGGINDYTENAGAALIEVDKFKTVANLLKGKQDQIESESECLAQNGVTSTVKYDKGKIKQSLKSKILTVNEEGELETIEAKLFKASFASGTQVVDQFAFKFDGQEGRRRLRRTETENQDLCIIL